MTARLVGFIFEFGFLTPDIIYFLSVVTLGAVTYVKLTKIAHV